MAGRKPLNENPQPDIAASAKKAESLADKKNTAVGVHRLQAAVSSLALWIRTQEHALSLRGVSSNVGKNAAIILFLALSCGWSHAAVYVYFPTTDPSLQSEFLANTTAQYNGTLSKVGVNYYFSVTTKKPAVPTSIDTCTAFGECMAHGFADGMDEERRQVVEIIGGMQGVDWRQKTCGGVPVGNVALSTTSAHSACLNSYNVISATISARSLSIFTSTGGFVQ